MRARRLAAFTVFLMVCGFAFANQRPAAADDYPNRRVTLLVAASAGGYADAVARIIGERLSQELGQSFVVENRGGAGGNIAAKVVASAPADGYTVLVTTTQFAINETLYKHAGVTAAEFRPVSIPVSAPETILANPSYPAKNLRDLIESAKGGTITFGSAGTGTGSYIQAQYLFRKLAKVETIHVPFPGGAPAISALLGNHVPVIAITVSPAIAQINQGSIRGLAIASPERLPLVKSVPTYAENGYPNYYASSWVGFFVPAKTPDDVLAKLNGSIGKILKEEAVRSRLEPFGVQFIHASLPQTSEFLNSEIKRWGEMVRALELSVE
jgi:tripartite-type tricarboxylate transporter receptor subunit TctC